MKVSLTLYKRGLDGIQKHIDKLNAEISVRSQQIDRAKAEGKEEFNEERYNILRNPKSP